MLRSVLDNFFGGRTPKPFCVDNFNTHGYNAGMSDDGDPSLYAHLYQWSARISTIAIEMVIPALIGIWLDRLMGTVVLLTIFGVFLGMALGFWQLVKIARDDHNIGVDKPSDTGDNGETSEN
jgi:hypothetical protein